MVNENIPHCAYLSTDNYINRVAYKVAYKRIIYS